MSLTSQPGAYRDCIELYNMALAAPSGVRMPISLLETDAKYFQLRMNNARRILRDESRRVYPPDSHLHGVSEYDGLQVRVRQHAASGIWWIYVEPAGVGHLLQYVEPIEAVPTTPTPTLALTHESPADDLDTTPLE